MLDDDVEEKFIEELAEFLSTNTTITSVSCYLLGSKEWEKILSTNKTIVEIRDIKTHSDFYEEFASVLCKSNCNLEQISFYVESSHNDPYFPKDDVELLATILNKNKSLTSLDLCKRNFDAEAMKLLATTLRNHKVLKRLNLSHSTSLADTVFADCITELTITSNELNSLQILLLGQCGNIGNNSIKSLRNATLQGSLSLTQLDLSGTAITEEEAKYLAEMISIKGCRLEALKLDSNKLTNKGLEHLVPALENNTSLFSLDLFGSGLVGEEAGKLLAKIFTNNKALRHVNLGFNPNLGEKAFELIANALKTGAPQLVDLELHSCNLTPATAILLSELLRNNLPPSLERLDLDLNQEIKPEAGNRLVDALAHNTTLKSLRISRIELDDSVESHLKEAFKTNRSLTLLDMWRSNFTNGENMVDEIQALSDNLKRINVSSA